jgi:polysaccharide pyruvyl transferase CsaB
MASVFVSAWVGAGNLGDELLFRRLLERLREVGADDVTVVSLDPSASESLHGVEALHPRNLLAATNVIRRADLLVVGPGGLLQDRSSPFNLPYQLHRAMLARALRTPVIGVGLGADPMGRRGSGTVLRLGLASARAIVVRAAPSATALGDHRLTAETTADLAFATPTPSATEPADVVAVSLRPWRSGGRAPVRWQRHPLVDEQVTATATALDQVAAETGLGIRFVAFEPHTDHPLHEAIAARLRADATCVIPTLDELVTTVADSRAVIATRFHAAVVGLVADRPVTAIGYAPKVTALAADLGDALPIVTDDRAGLTGLASAVAVARAIDPATRRNGLATLREREAANAPLLAQALGG